MSLLELNLDHTGMGLGITSKQSALLQTGKFQGESLLAAGKHFQEHRYNLQPSYVANCIHDTSGLQSVSFEGLDTNVIGKACNIGKTDCCTDCNVKAYLHNGKSFVHRNKGFLFTEYNELFLVDCDMCLKPVELRGLSRSQLKDVVDITSVQGKRIVIMTKDEIYYSSLLDGTGKTGNWTTDSPSSSAPYLDFYNLAGATGKFSISSSIGINKKLVTTGNFLYFLGSEGGAVTNQCNDDELYPFSLKVVKDFEGIEHVDHANVQTDKGKDFYVRSKSGLGLITQDLFQPQFDELDDELNRDVAVYFKITDCGCECFVEECKPCDGSILESSSITNSTLTEYTSEESLTDKDDFDSEYTEEWDDPLFFEQSGYKPSHFKVTTTTRWLAISYNSGKVIGDCEDSCVCYNRLYLHDRRINSGSVLHVSHTDVSVVDSDLYINSDGILKKMVRRFSSLMPSIVFYQGFEMYNDKWVQLTELTLQGRFPECEDKGNCIDPIFSVKTEDPEHQYHDSMSLYHKSPHKINFGDIIRGESLDFVVPFAGYLSAIKLDYHK